MAGNSMYQMAEQVQLTLSRQMYFYLVIADGGEGVMGGCGLKLYLPNLFLFSCFLFCFFFLTEKCYWILIELKLGTHTQ